MRWTPIPMAEDETDAAKVTSWAVAEEEPSEDGQPQVVLTGMTFKRAIQICTAHNLVLSAVATKVREASTKKGGK